MFLSHSISIDSTSSSTTMSNIQRNEQLIDPSNILYNDQQNYQIIFSNDSRFFDTSLHLFKSYCNLGYIQSNNKKSKKKLFPSSSHTPKPVSNGPKKHWRSKSTGFSTNYDTYGNLNGTLKPPTLDNHGRSISQRSDPNSSNLITPQIKRENLPTIVSYQRQSTLSNHSATNSDSSDEADIVVTRL